MDNPKLRPVNAFPVESDGRRFYCLQDPMRLTEKQVFLDEETFFIVAMMDGMHSLSDIQLQYVRRYGGMLLNNRLDGIIRDLDENLFLDSPRSQEAQRKVIEDFRQQPVRHAEHAGSAYEADPEKLSSQLDEILALAPPPTSTGPATSRLSGIVAPHIDIRVGAEGYAHAYRPLAAENAPPDLFIVLGISHSWSGREFALTYKDFETPLGISATHREFVEGLSAHLDGDYFEDEFAHKNEHSIEFQVVFLQHILKAVDFRIVPILCGGFHNQIEQDVLPEMDPGIRGFLDSLSASISEYPGRVCVVAGVDLSHVGAKFGTPGRLDQAQLKRIETADRELLECVSRNDRTGYFRHIELDKNGRNVCGFAAIYTLMYLLKDVHGEILHYAQHFEPATSSMVSFASMSFRD